MTINHTIATPPLSPTMVNLNIDKPTCNTLNNSIYPGTELDMGREKDGEQHQRREAA